MFQKVHQAQTQIEAEMAVSLLAAAGLHPAEVRPWPHIMFAGADLGFWVEVPAEEVEAARQILSQRPASEPSPTLSSAVPTVLKAAVIVVLVLISLGVLLP